MPAMKRLLPILLAAASLAGCATSPYGPPEPPPPPYEAPPSPSLFRAQDFAWSTEAGDSAIYGTLAFRVGALRYTCQGGDVVLTPETPWSRRRMTILYGSSSSAAVAVAQVRARMPSASNEDYARFVHHATCDGANHFNFRNLPDGGWFAITVAKPVGTPGEPVAVMRRVETHGGPRSLTLN